MFCVRIAKTVSWASCEICGTVVSRFEPLSFSQELVAPSVAEEHTPLQSFAE